jgi:hypothetical protein
MAAGRHRRRLSRWTRVRRALAGVVTLPIARGRHRSGSAVQAELLRLRQEVAGLHATAATLRSELAVARDGVASTETRLAAARAEAETAKAGHRLALERLRTEVEHNAEAAAAARAAAASGAELQISLLLPLVREAMARTAAAASPTPELDAFPRTSTLEELVGADRRPTQTEIDLRHGRHARVA